MSNESLGPAIKTEHLFKNYGASRGIVDLNLTVRRGEIYGFIGPNGAGKTTTIRLCLGLIKPSGGHIELLGEKCERFGRKIFSQIGYLPGEIGLYKNLSGLEYLNHLMNLRGGSGNGDLSERKSFLIKRFGIDLRRKIRGYSKGMKQIVGIIQAFLHDPLLYILDEPTSGLDPLMQEVFYDLLLEECGRGKTFFLSSHNLREVERVCGRIGVIKEGRLISEQAIEKHRTIVGKKISIMARGPVSEPPKKLINLSGVRELTLRRNKIEFFYNGDMKILAHYLDDPDFEDFTCEIPSLEDIFMRYYSSENYD